MKILFSNNFHSKISSKALLLLEIALITLYMINITNCTKNEKNWRSEIIEEIDKKILKLNNQTNNNFKTPSDIINDGPDLMICFGLYIRTEGKEITENSEKFEKSLDYTKDKKKMRQRLIYKTFADCLDRFSGVPKETIKEKYPHSSLEDETIWKKLRKKYFKLDFNVYFEDTDNLKKRERRARDIFSLIKEIIQVITKILILASRRFENE